MNFNNSKQAYYFLSCYGNEVINFAILLRMSKGDVRLICL